jgi:hypothetical protein
MPDTLAVAAIRYSGVPVVFDSRDVSSGMDSILLKNLKISFLNTLQSSIYSKLIKKYEREANERSSGRIYVSHEMLNYLCNIYKIEKERSIVLPNYQSKSFAPISFLEKLSYMDKCLHVVYIGNILFDDFDRTIDLIKQLGVHPIHLHLYPVGDKGIIDRIKSLFSNNPYIHFNKPLPLKDLTVELTKYDFGLTPRPPDRNSLNYRFALPNKLFDYLAAGLQIAARNTVSIKRFVKENEVGFIYNTSGELVKKLLEKNGRYKIYPERFIMENHIDGVLKLYDQILDQNIGEKK